VLESNHAHDVARKPLDRLAAVTPLPVRARSQVEALHGEGCGCVGPSRARVDVLPTPAPLRFEGRC
jgi:hypothetical protein